MTDELNFDDLIPTKAQASAGPQGTTGDLSFDDLVPTSKQQENPKVPTTPKKPKRGLDDDFLRQLGLTARAGVTGIAKTLSYPVNAIGTAASGVAHYVGAQDAANYLERNLGMKGGEAAANTLADSLGLPKPENDTEKKVQNIAGVLAGSATGNVVSGAGKVISAASKVLPSKFGVDSAVNNLGTAVAKLPGPASSVLPTTNTVTDAAINGGIAAGMEYSPKTTLGVGGAVLAASLARKPINSALAKVSAKMEDNRINNTADRLFKDNPLAARDAEIILDLQQQRKYNNTNLGKKDIPLSATDANEVAKGYVRNLEYQLEKAGLNSPEISNAIQGRKALSNLDPDILSKLNSTPEGQAVLANLDKANRVSQLTPAENATSGAPKVLRTLISGGIDSTLSAMAGVPLPISTSVREGLNKFLGGRTYRWENAEKAVQPLNIKAAQRYLAQNGPSDATQGLGILSQLGESRASTETAKEAAEKAALILKNNAQARARGLKELDLRKAQESALAQATQERNNAILQANQEARLRGQQSLAQGAADSSQAQAAEEARRALILENNRKARLAGQAKVAPRDNTDPLLTQAAQALAEDNAKAGVITRSNKFNTMMQHTGMAEDELHSALDKLATENPSIEPLIKAVHDRNTSIPEAAFYDLQQRLKTMKQNQGVLSQPQGSGVLSGVMRDNSGAQIRSPNLYTSKIDANQAQYLQDAKDLAASDLPSVVKKTALDVNKVLKTTGDDAKRQAAIQEMLNKHPEYATNLLAIFKPYMK